MEPQARGVEATPLLRKRDDTHGGWFAGVGLFSTRRGDASGASRGARAVLALGAAAMLCVGAASTSAGKDVISSLGASSSAAAEADLTSLGGSPAVAVGQLGDDPAFKHPENIVKYPTPLPDVDFSGKTLLIVMGHPFSGTSALEGLIGTGSGVTDLCKSGTWQCEDTWLLKYMDFNIEPGVDEWDEYYPVDAAGYAYAFKHFARTWWDMSKPLLMDKTPNLLAHYRTVVDAAAKLGVPVKFVLLTRHPFSWTSETHPFNQGLWMELMKFSLRVLNDPNIEVHQVKYEDLAWNMYETIDKLQAFLPQLGKLNPWGSALQEPKDAAAKELNGDRAMGIAQYFQNEPLDWKPLPLDDDTFRMLCAVGYNNDGECEY